MKSRRINSVKPGLRRKKGASDVSPSTSLPPLVEGQLHCFLRVSVGKILWTVLKPPSPALVRLRWWGETSNGTIFRPRDSSRADQKGVKTTARYAVRCGPKQLISYLTDMGSLVLEIMTKLDHLPIGRVQINGIPRLSPAHPISGFFTIVSPTSEKLGELQVSVALEPLSETYDSSGSIPNTDISANTAASVRASKDEPGFPSQPKLLLPQNRRDSESSRVSTPRGRDHLYFQENADPNKGSFRGSQDHLNIKEAPNTGGLPSMKQTTAAYNAQETPDDPAAAPGSAAKDLISVLLGQGSKLREAMVVSALKSDPIVDLDEDKRRPVSLNEEVLAVTKSAPDVPSPRFLQNLVNVHNSPPGKGVLLQGGGRELLETETPSGTNAIELLLGSSMASPEYYWDGTGSPPESISGFDVFNESEFNDPHYDQSLLEHLFYTAPKSDSSLSDFISDDDRRQARRKKSKKTGKDPAARRDRSPAEKEHTGSEQTADRSFRGTVKSAAVDLPMDRLAELGRMNGARVVVDTLKVLPEDKQGTPRKRSSRGKPPRPLSAVKRTFFVEFLFPASSKSKAGEVTVATEVTRLVSSKIVGGFVKFQQRFAFPVAFSGPMLEHWWSSDLIFRIFLRKASQKKPVLVGSAGLSLRDVLLSERLSVSRDLRVDCIEPQQDTADVGPLKVSVELAGDSKDPTRTPGKVTESAKQAPRPSISHNASLTEPETPSTSDSEPLPAEPAAKHSIPQRPAAEEPRASASQPRASASQPRASASQPRAAEESSLLLHVVLMVPEGKGLMPASADSPSACNSYLKCKLFSSPEASRSAVAWGTTQPVYNFTQVAPVGLTSHLLERLKNNVMVIEVWSKVSGPGQDRLLGLAKLPLHQFFLSFSDPKISRLLLQAQYPVVAVDSLVAVTDVFGGGERGKLKVLLAMGSGDQVVALQRLKHEEGASPAQVPRPAHFLDPPQATSQVFPSPEATIDHVFEIHVENVKGLTPLQSTVWGEADCFVQYYFPERSPSPGDERPESGVSLKPVRTATTLCVPDPVFNDRQSHSLVAPSDTPVQRLLLGALSAQGLSGGGGVTFEIWCRYYYPNVRDQMVANGLLPLSRLCAMVTMQHREEVGIQAFSLPLTPRIDTPGEQHPRSSGLLNVNVTYRRSVRNAVGMLATRMVSISVQIHRASGLQAAARLIAEHEPAFQYSADVGVNAFVTVHPSFLPEAERRSTRTVARTFSPEFDHHSEFPCNLVIQRRSGEACSLAEIMSCSEIVFSIHHRSVTSDHSGRSHPARDSRLGEVRIPAKDLLSKRSGVSGWYPVTAAERHRSTGGPSILESVVGGLELSISFTHPADRERVLEAARGLGWSQPQDRVREVSLRGEDEWQMKEDLVTMSVSVPKIWLPVHCLLLAGQKRLHRSTYCYLRYKLYDREAFCSPLKRPQLSEDGQQASVMFEKTRSIELMRHQPLVWYLKEERLEIQIWRAYGKDADEPRPQDTDRLLGCAYVDLTALSEATSRTLTVSGVYPLFKRGVSNLLGAAVRVHLSLSSAYHPPAAPRSSSPSDEMSHSEEEVPEDAAEDHREKEPAHHTKGGKTAAPAETPSQRDHPADKDVENTFAVNIVIERAMHLSLKGSPLTERAVSTPSCCVSFPVAGSATPVATPVIENTDAPVWDFQYQTRLTNELLVDPQQTLVFKVWHKTDVERVLGFAAVDLSPLLSGFHSVCGWYNIGDFTGQCQGQIKVSITPLEGIGHLREERRARNKTSPAPAEGSSHKSLPFQPTPAFCGSFSTFSSGRTGEVAAVLSDPPADRGGGVSGNEEPADDVRRFLETLQLAERNAHSAEQRGALSQSSRTSLLSALRKNLGELDDIQKYFKQKLYRSISNADHEEGSSVPSRGRQEKPPLSAPRQEDSDTQQLLKKSSLLVSQVSSLITDLQGFHTGTPDYGTSDYGTPDYGTDIQRLDASDPASLPDSRSGDTRSAGHEELGADEAELPQVATPPFSLRGSPDPQTDDLELLKGSGASVDGSLVDEQHQEELDDTRYASDEDYEEDFIEPRTLNEVTAMTDRTSPWSSMLSDVDPPSAERHLHGTDETQHAGVSSGNKHAMDGNVFSSLYPKEHPSVPSASEEPETSDKGSTVRGFLHLPNGDSERAAQDEPRSASTGIQRAQEGLLEELDRNDDPEPDEPPLVRQASESPSEGSDPESSVGASYAGRSTPSPLPQADYSESDRPSADSQQNSNASEESTAEVPGRCGDLLSDPVLVPNFFLPPQHLEASMRMLSVSPALPSAADSEAETRIARGIPFRRNPRPKPKLTGTDLPEEETRRIARIFAAQFTKPK
ncbi:C2 domain-containing protein 3 [Spea bombifrons]|uniref:C2 domain-containing protein 3 n=1 Tax=Spea bombifrons TaxID=233779 RepID=UPI002349B384|nr:C2 domain-containing protein 3 [Spea bombifrons]